MSPSFLTGEPVEVTALSFDTRAALASFAFAVLCLVLVFALLWWRRRGGAELHVLSLSVWVPAVVLASVAIAPVGGWGLDVAATQALVFLYAFMPIYLFVRFVDWVRRRGAR